MAPNAAIIGDVFISKWATIWYNVTIRGEHNPVRIGQFSSIGDGTSINTTHSLPHGIASSVTIGKNVTVEARCSLHSCIIDDDCIIGENSVIMQGCRIERGAVVLPNSVVPPGRCIPGGQVWGGNPITFVRNLTDQEQLDNYAASYNNGAGVSQTESFSLWPHEVKTGELQAGEDSMDDYAHKKYFKNL